MRKWLKVIGIVVIVMVILLFGVQWWLGHKIKNTIEEEVKTETQGRIQLAIGGVKVSLIGRSVRLKDIQVKTDSARPFAGNIPFEYAKGDIPEIALSKVHFKKQDSLLAIRAGKLDVNLGELLVIVPKSTETKASEIKNQTSKQQRIELQLKEIVVESRGIRMEQIQAEDTVSYQLKDFYCKVEDAQFHKGEDTTKMPFYCKDLQVSFNNFRNQFARKTQLLEVDSLSIRGKEGRISVGHVNLIPLYSKDEFAMIAPGHIDWTQIHTGKIECYGLDMQSMMQDKLLKIDSTGIEGARISSYKNRQIEQVKRVKRLFYESVQELPLSLFVRRIGLRNINVEYQELAQKGLSPGTITFDRLEGVFYELTNIVRPSQPYFTLKARGKLMDQGAIEATFQLPIDSLNNHFQVEGSLGEMSLSALNPMIEPLVKVKITSGEVEGMKFKITGNSMKEKIDMIFLYRDLKIRVMREKDGQLKVSSFFTTLANGLIAKGNNPDHRGVREVEGTAERDVYRSQFNYLWRALLAGLKTSIGL